MNQTQSPNQVFNRILQAVVLLYQFVAVAAFIVSVFFAVRWMNQPFLGGFFESTLVLNGTGKNTSTQQPWSLYEQGFVFGDQLIAVDGKPVKSSADIRNALASFQTGDSVALLLQTSAGETKTAEITIQAFPSADRFAYFIIPALISGVFLFVGLWIFGFRRNEPAGRAFSIFSSSLGISIGALFNLYTTHEFSHLWTLSVALAGGAAAGGEVRRRLVHQGSEQAREQVDLDPLAEARPFPLAQRRQDRDHGVLAGQHVHERDADLGRLAVGSAGDAHQPTQSLHDEVVARQRGTGAAAEPGDRAVDEPGV